MVVKTNNAHEKDPDLGSKDCFFRAVEWANNLIDLFFDEGKDCDWMPVREFLDESYHSLSYSARVGLERCYHAMVEGVDAVVLLTKDGLINCGHDENNAQDVARTSNYISRYMSK